MTKKVSKKSKRRLMTFGMFSIFAIGYFCFTLIGYVYNYINLKNEEKALRAELLSLQDTKSDLKIEIQKLNDPNYVIRYAKEKFLYSTDGEYVLKLNEQININNEAIEKNNTMGIVISSLGIFILVIVLIKFKQNKLTKKKI